MKVGIGAAHLSTDTPSGLNRYTGGVIEELLRQHRESVLYASDVRAVGTAGERGRHVRPEFLKQGNLAGNFGRLVWNQTVLPRLLRQDDCDVYYSPLPEGVLRPNRPQVITVHDLLPLLFPEDNPRLKYYYRAVLPGLVRASAAVIAVSESTRADIERLLRPGDRPIHVVYQGFRSELFRPSSPLEMERVRRTYGLDDFVLSVGETRRYKNVRRLIQAFERLSPPGISLVIAGKVNRLDREIQALPKRFGASDRIRFLGVVPDRDLAALYSAAKAFAFPSLYEGFGIPPLEAMGCGCVVVTSRTASLPEVCGNEAIYVDPEDVDSIAGGLGAALHGGEGIDALRRGGRERAATFDYAAMARRTLEILHGVGRDRRDGRAGVHGIRSAQPLVGSAGTSTPDAGSD